MARFFVFYIFIHAGIFLAACTSTQHGEKTESAQSTFTNPLLNSGADPWVIQKDDWYYVTHTTGKNLRLYRTRNMADLRNAEVKTVWTPPAAGMNSKQIWAPELHFLEGKWYFYYAADDGLNENHRMWVLENDADDPFSGTWVDRGELELPDDKWAIDGSPFQYNDELFFLWSGWEGDINVRQNLYIVKMANPYTAEGERVLLSTPEHEWELKGGKPAINEAPQYLARGDKIFIFYSASGCWTDDYTIGILSAPSGSDPMDPSAWTKFSEPVFSKNPAGQAFGPGHHSFFTSPDGAEDWILYHANPEAGQGCGGNRSMRMQPYQWKSDGFPDFGNPVALGDPLQIPSAGK